jgi:glycosyltransferase involved in cell wall biosynthesis
VEGVFTAQPTQWRKPIPGPIPLLSRRNSMPEKANDIPTDNPLIISIVTPSFNQGEFIDETIRSILTQRGSFYIDYIIMDGGSTDRSVDIIKEYEDLLPHGGDTETIDGLPYFTRENKPYGNLLPIYCLGISYRWYSEKDRGQVHALKKGFQLAKGDIFYWLNSDDILVNQDVFQDVIHQFQDSPDLKLLTGDGPFISKEGKELGIHHVDRINPEELIFLDYHILQPSTFFRREVYKEEHLEEAYTCAFDADFFIRMIVSGVRYKKVDQHYGAFRFYDDNKTLGLSNVRYKEQKKIARTYSGNRFYYFISSFYRYFEICLKPRYAAKNRTFASLFLILKKISYKLITGKSER